MLEKKAEDVGDPSLGDYFTPRLRFTCDEEWANETEPWTDDPEDGRSRKKFRMGLAVGCNISTYSSLLYFRR